MASNEVEIRVTADTKNAERGLSGMRKSLGNFSRSAKIAGAALTGIAAGGFLLMKRFGQASLVQQKAVSTLAATMAAQGESFKSMEEQIMSVTAALQKKTNFGDEVQIQALARLTASLGSTETALKMLPVLIDLAAFRGKDLTSVVETLGPVLAGTTTTLASLSMKFDESEGTMDRAARIMGVVKGSAEAVADPFIQMGNAIGDVEEKIGDQFMPVLAPMMQLIQKLAENIQAMNPQTQRMIGLIVIGTVAFAGIVGPILLLIGFLPMIAGGFVALAGAMLPITIGLGILAAAVVIGITAWKNWDKVVDFLQRVFHSKFFWLLPGGPLIKALVFLVQNWKTVWNFVKDTLRGAADIILQKVENILNGFVDMVNGVIRVAKRLGFMKDVAEIEQFSLSFEDMKESAQTAMVELVGVVAEKGKEFGGAIKEAMIDVAGDAADFFNKQMDAAGLGFKEMTDAVAEGVDAAIPKLGTELPDALDKTGKAFERAGEKAKSFNDLVSAGQFKSRVRGGRPEMVAWGAGGAKVSKMPSFMDDPRVAEQLLMSVAAMANPTARAQRLQGLIGSGGAIDPKFNQLIAHIKSADVFTKQQMIDFEKPYRLALKKEKEQKALEESQLLSENMMANGGIVTRPTVALVGEAGPEAIIPLGRGRGMAPVYNITISNNTVFGEMDFKRLVVKAVTDSHRRGGLPFLGKA